MAVGKWGRNGASEGGRGKKLVLKPHLESLLLPGGEEDLGRCGLQLRRRQPCAIGTWLIKNISVHRSPKC